MMNEFENNGVMRNEEFENMAQSVISGGMRTPERGLAEELGDEDSVREPIKEPEKVMDFEAAKEKKAAVNVLDLLLGGDAGKIKTPYKDIEITRLSEAYGSPFVVRCEALTPETYESIQDMSVNISGKDVDLDMNVMQMLTVIEGVRLITEDARGNKKAAGCLFKNGQLMSHFDAPSPKELCRKLLLSGEVAKLYNTISALSGFSDTSIKEVKN